MKEYWYLREGDLRPERLADNLILRLDARRCRNLYKSGLLFHNRKDALRVREIMLRAYISEAMRVKGADAI